MPKTKTKAGAKKRFSYTGSGKIKRKQAYMSHLLRNKTKKQKRRLNHSRTMHRTNKKRVDVLLNHK